jgi:hypothetical protein
MKSLSDNTHNIITFRRTVPVLSTIFFIVFFGCFSLYFFSTHTEYPIHIKLFQITACALIIIYACYNFYQCIKRIRVPILQLSPTHLEYDAPDWRSLTYDKDKIKWKDISSVSFESHRKYYGCMLCIKVGNYNKIKIALHDIAASPYSLRKAFEYYKPIPLSPMRVFYYDHLYPWRYLLVSIGMVFAVLLIGFIQEFNS